MNAFANRIKGVYNELISLQSATQKSAGSIDLMSRSINIQRQTSEEYITVTVKITPVNSSDMIWSASLNKLDGDDGGQTFETIECFSGDYYVVDVSFGRITNGLASATLTVVATDDFSMEVING